MSYAHLIFRPFFNKMNTIRKKIFLFLLLIKRKRAGLLIKKENEKKSSYSS